MDDALRSVKMTGLKKEIVDQINHIRLHKILCLPLELVGAAGRPITDAFDLKNNLSQLKWKFKFPKVDAPGIKSMKT